MTEKLDGELYKEIEALQARIKILEEIAAAARMVAIVQHPGVHAQCLIWLREVLDKHGQLWV